MNNLAILPIIIPLISGAILAFVHSKVSLSRTLAKLFMLINLG